MSSKVQRKSEAGFTLMETMIAVLILAVGVLALAAILGDGLAYMGMAQDEYIAEQKAAETVESIYTARDVSQTSWVNINNASGGRHLHRRADATVRSRAGWDRRNGGRRLHQAGCDLVAGSGRTAGNGR